VCWKDGCRWDPQKNFKVSTETVKLRKIFETMEGFSRNARNMPQEACNTGKDDDDDQ
jgi:hypothetical protein